MAHGGHLEILAHLFLKEWRYVGGHFGGSVSLPYAGGPLSPGGFFNLMSYCNQRFQIDNRPLFVLAFKEYLIFTLPLNPDVRFRF